MNTQTTLPPFTREAEQIVSALRDRPLARDVDTECVRTHLERAFALGQLKAAEDMAKLNASRMGGYS